MIGCGNGFERISSSPVYRIDAVCRRAGGLQAHPLTLGAQAVMHPDDARNIGLGAGMMVKVGDGIGTAALPLSVSAAIAVGCVWIESQYAASAPLSQTGSLAITRAGL
jgi:NADH-quinone oxidoreductase subunit G